jgi:signal-transduction protein with cAMP-binding, CBS, and nucleotidyltransferase domain
VITVSPDESVNRVMNLMTRHRVRHMPVLRDGKLAGIISIGDVVKHRLDDLELETHVLRDAYTLTLSSSRQHATKPCFFCPPHPNGFGWCRAVSRNLKI